MWYFVSRWVGLFEGLLLILILKTNYFPREVCCFTVRTRKNRWDLLKLSFIRGLTSKIAYLLDQRIELQIRIFKPSTNLSLKKINTLIGNLLQTGWMQWNWEVWWGEQSKQQLHYFTVRNEEKHEVTRGGHFEAFIVMIFTWFSNGCGSVFSSNFTKSRWP